MSDIESENSESVEQIVRNACFSLEELLEFLTKILYFLIEIKKNDSENYKNDLDILMLVLNTFDKMEETIANLNSEEIKESFSERYLKKEPF